MLQVVDLMLRGLLQMAGELVPFTRFGDALRAKGAKQILDFRAHDSGWC